MIYRDRYGKFHYSGEISWMTRDEYDNLGMQAFFDEEA